MAKTFQKGLPPKEDIENKVVILVDDDIISGATIMSPIIWLRRHCNPRKIILASPVVTTEALAIIRYEVDHVVSILNPPKESYSSRNLYKRYELVTDSDVARIIQLRDRSTRR